MAPIKHTCVFCDKVFLSNSKLEVHMLSHTKEQPFFCNYCEKSYSRNDSLKKHIKAFHNNFKKVHRVDISNLGKMNVKHLFENRCGETGCDLQNGAKTTSDLKNGAEPGDLVIKQMEVLVTCKYCRKIFSNRRNMLQHIRNVHRQKWEVEKNEANTDKKRNSFRCNHCNRAYTHQDSWRHHMRQAHPDIWEDEKSKRKMRNKGMSIPCDECKNTFSSKSTLKRHMLQIHKPLLPDEPKETKKGKSDPCKICDKTFFDRSSLTKHMRRIHNHVSRRHKNKEKLFTCEHCGKSFVQGSSMRFHIRQKHQEKLEAFPGHLNKANRSNSFTCKQCGKCFSHRSSMRLHISRTHKKFFDDQKIERDKKNKEKPFQCKLCQTYFMTQNTLRHHMLKFHKEQFIAKQKKLAKEKPFPCDHCDRGYKTQKCLRAHERQAHKSKARRIYYKRGTFSKKCLYCGHGFFRCNYYLLQHQKNCKRKNDYKCDTCGDIFIDKKFYLSHLRSFCLQRSIEYKCLLCKSYEGKDPLTILEHVMKCKQNGKFRKYYCFVCQHKFNRKTGHLHTQYELLHSNLFKDVPCDFKCESCKISFPNENLLRLHQELEHPCILHMVGLEDLDGFTIDDDKKYLLMKERKRIRDLEIKGLEFKGKPPKHRCHVCLFPFHSKFVQGFHAKACQRKFGVTKQHVYPERQRQPGNNVFPRRIERPLHCKLTTDICNKLHRRLIDDMDVNEDFVSNPEYCDYTERDLKIPRGTLRKWIPEVLRDYPVAKAFFGKNLFNEDIAVIEVKKADPVMIDISDESKATVSESTKFKCKSCHKECVSEDELLFHMDTATGYFMKKYNALLEKNRQNKRDVIIPSEPTDYDDLTLWIYKGKFSKHFCIKCGHPYHSRFVRDFHARSCKVNQESQQETTDSFQDTTPETRPETLEMTSKVPRLSLVKYD